MFKIPTELRTVCQVIRHTVPAEQVYLFGSYAYGVPTADSDYDLCVIIPDGTLRPVDALKKIRRALYSIQNTPLDIVVYHKSNFERRQKSASLERKILKEGVLLYGQPEFEQRVV